MALNEKRCPGVCFETFQIAGFRKIKKIFQSLHKIVFKAACLIFVTHYVTIFQFTTYVRTIYYNNFSSFCCWEMNGSLRVHFCLFVLNNEFINTIIKGLESGQSILKIHAWIIFLYWLSSQTVNISIANNSSTGIVPLNKYFLHLNLKQLLLELKQLELWLFLRHF